MRVTTYLRFRGCREFAMIFILRRAAHLAHLGKIKDSRGFACDVNPLHPQMENVTDIYTQTDWAHTTGESIFEACASIDRNKLALTAVGLVKRRKQPVMTSLPSMARTCPRQTSRTFK